MFQFPIMLVCLAGLFVVMVNWRKVGSRSLWPALGFGLALVFCFALPIIRQAFWAAVGHRTSEVVAVLFWIFCTSLEALPYLAFAASWFLECRARSQAGIREPVA